MPDEVKTGEAGGQTGDPKAGKEGAATREKVRDPEAVLAHNAELLGELQAARAKLRKHEEADAARVEAQKKQEGKYEEIIAARDEALRQRAETLKAKEVSLLMQRHGLIDPDYVAILSSRIEFDDEFSAVNADKIFEDLKKEKPFLFSSEKSASAKRAPGVSSAQAASGIKPGHVFTRAEIRTLMESESGRAVLRENKAELDRQWAAGLVK